VHVGNLVWCPIREASNEDDCEECEARRAFRIVRDEYKKRRYELMSLTMSYAGEFAKTNMIVDKQFDEIESLKAKLAKARGES
jgi:hypothetical protein